MRQKVKKQSVPAYLIVQTSPEAVVDVATTAILDHEPPKARLEALEAVVVGRGRGGRGRGPQRALVLGCCCCCGGWLSLAVGGIVVVIVVGTAATVVALDLSIKAGDYALEAAQSLEQLGIRGFPALSRGTAGAWEDTVDFGAHTVGARVLLVTFDLAPTAGNARPGVWCRCRSSAGRGAVGRAAWLAWIGRVLAGAPLVGHSTDIQVNIELRGLKLDGDLYRRRPLCIAQDFWYAHARTGCGRTFGGTTPCPSRASELSQHQIPTNVQAHHHVPVSSLLPSIYLVLFSTSITIYRRTPIHGHPCIARRTAVIGAL